MLRRTGIDIVRYREKINPLAFLRHYSIKTVIDVGANVGQFAAEIRAALPEAFIYSFEPMKECYEKLQSSRRHDPKFKAFNVALGETAGQSVIHKNSYAPSSSMLSNSKLLEQAFPFTAESTDEKIEVKTLDSVLSAGSLQKNILLKLDVQGYEEKVLRGDLKLLEQTSIVLAETSFYTLYEGQPLFEDMYTFLHDRGFEYHGSLQNKRHPKTGEILFEDSIFMRTGLKNASVN
jgi:FkbM family methyltransferase